MVELEYCGWVVRYMFFFFFKQKTAYEMRISDWSSDVCSSDLDAVHGGRGPLSWCTGEGDRKYAVVDRKDGANRERPGNHADAQEQGLADGAARPGTAYRAASRRSGKPLRLDRHSVSVRGRGQQFPSIARSPRRHGQLFSRHSPNRLTVTPPQEHKQQNHG